MNNGNINLNTSGITLNINRVKTIVVRPTLSKWIKWAKTKSTYALQDVKKKKVKNKKQERSSIMNALTEERCYGYIVISQLRC